MVKYMLVMIKSERNISHLKSFLSSYVHNKEVEWILFDTFKGLKDFAVR